MGTGTTNMYRGYLRSIIYPTYPHATNNGNNRSRLDHNCCQLVINYKVVLVSEGCSEIISKG